MSITTELGRRIRFYRKERHISQEALAELCNLHPTYIGQLERGEKNATIESLYRISQGLDISLSELLENIDIVDDPVDNPAIQIYQECQLLSTDQQQHVLNILHDIIKMLD